MKTRWRREVALQSLWFAGDLAEGALRTEDGLPVEVLDPGTWNRGGGPDFLGAFLRIGGRDERGDVEVHLDPGDWDRHGHGEDEAYDHVVLHVTLRTSREVGERPAGVRPGATADGRAAAAQAAGEVEATGRGQGRSPAGGGSSARCGHAGRTRHHVVVAVDDLSIGRSIAGGCRSALGDEAVRARVRAGLMAAGRAKVERRAERLHRESERVGGAAALLRAFARALGQPENGATLAQWVGEIGVARLDDACQDPDGVRDPTRVEAILLARAPWRDAGDPASDRYRRAIEERAGAEARESGGAAASAGWRFGGTRPMASPWRRLAGLAALLSSFGGPTLLHEETARMADVWGRGGDESGAASGDPERTGGGRGRRRRGSGRAAGVDVRRMAARFLRRDPGYWAVRGRPGPVTFARPAAMIGSAAAERLVTDAVLPFLLERLQARGDDAGVRGFWAGVERLSAPPPDGVVRFVLDRLGEPRPGLEPLVTTWLGFLGAHWYFRSACGAGAKGCAGCIWNVPRDAAVRRD